MLVKFGLPLLKMALLQPADNDFGPVRRPLGHFEFETPALMLGVNKINKIQSTR